MQCKATIDVIEHVKFLTTIKSFQFRNRYLLLNKPKEQLTFEIAMPEVNFPKKGYYFCIKLSCDYLSSNSEKI